MAAVVLSDIVEYIKTGASARELSFIVQMCKEAGMVVVATFDEDEYIEAVPPEERLEWKSLARTMNEHFEDDGTAHETWKSQMLFLFVLVGCKAIELKKARVAGTWEEAVAEVIAPTGLHGTRRPREVMKRRIRAGMTSGSASASSSVSPRVSKSELIVSSKEVVTQIVGTTSVDSVAPTMSQVYDMTGGVVADLRAERIGEDVSDVVLTKTAQEQVRTAMSVRKKQQIDVKMVHRTQMAACRTDLYKEIATWAKTNFNTEPHLLSTDVLDAFVAAMDESMVQGNSHGAARAAPGGSRSTAALSTDLRHGVTGSFLSICSGAGGYQYVAFASTGHRSGTLAYNLASARLRLGDKEVDLRSVIGPDMDVVEVPTDGTMFSSDDVTKVLKDFNSRWNRWQRKKYPGFFMDGGKGDSVGPIMIMDGASTHKTATFVSLAVAGLLSILYLPGYTSGFLQYHDVFVFGVLKFFVYNTIIVGEQARRYLEEVLKEVQKYERVTAKKEGQHIRALIVLGLSKALFGNTNPFSETPTPFRKDVTCQ